MLPKIRADFDEDDVYFYQAFKPSFADFSVANQRFGGDDFKPARMTWIKPSFAWVLYRSGYAMKHNQERILKVNLSHEVVFSILAACNCPEGGADSTHPPTPITSSASASRGVVQWDPARDLNCFDSKNKKVPRKMFRERAIQIGLGGGLSDFYVNNTLSIEDLTKKAREVGRAHGEKNEKDCEEAVQAMFEAGRLQIEKEYEPEFLQDAHKLRLGLLPGEAADRIAQLGRGGVKT